MTDPPIAWALPEGLEVPRDELRLRLDFYESTLVLQHFNNGVITTRQVSAAAVTDALTRNIVVASGLLPKETLWWKNTGNGPLVALWVPPRVQAVAMQDKAFEAPTRLRVPMPGAVFLCAPGQPPWVFAVKRRPQSATDPVFKFPSFNVFKDGCVCSGTHTWSQRIEEIPVEFFVSFFSHTGDFGGRSKKYPKDLRALWTELDGKKRFPADDLVQDGQIGNVMELPKR